MTTLGAVRAHRPSTTISVTRLYRPLMLGLTIILAGLVAAIWASALMHPAAFSLEIGGDFRAYTDGARRWLAGGPFYQPYQLAGPYAIGWQRDVALLYPPSMLVLLVPFTVAPPVLWWVIPIGITMAVIAHHRPAPWAWPMMLAPFLVAHSNQVLVNGTPTIWIVAFLALSTIWPWTGALVLFKPSVLPFAVAGMRDARWWVLAVLLAVVSLPMATEYLTVLRNSDGSLLYSVQDIPLLLIPVIAWAARR